MSLQTAGDVPISIISENSTSERRITPSWTIGQLKAKLEPVTGIPPLSQKLTLRLGSQVPTPIEAEDEENTQLIRFPLAPYAEIHVSSPFSSYYSMSRSLRETCCDTSSLVPNEAVFKSGMYPASERDVCFREYLRATSFYCTGFQSNKYSVGNGLRDVCEQRCVLNARRKTHVIAAIFEADGLQPHLKEVVKI